MQNNYDSRRADEGVTYAGFWVRLAAYLIDSVIVFFLLLVVRAVMSVLSGTALGGNILFSYTLKDIVLYLGEVLYFILCTRYTGTTLGKRAMNLRVIRVDESGELDFLTIAYRETVGRFLCGISICIGYLIIGLDREKRGFHDMLCDTRVVYGKKVKIYPVPPQNVPYGTGYPATPQNEQYGAVYPVPPQNGSYDSIHREPTQNDVSNTVYSATQQNGSYGTVHPATQQNGSYGTVHPATQQNGSYGTGYSVPPQNGPYRMVHPEEQNVRPEMKEEKGDSSEL